MRKKLLFAGGLLSFAMALGMMFGFNTKGNEATPVLATEKVTIVSVGGNPIDHEATTFDKGDFPMGEINVPYEAQLVADNMNPSGTYKWSISIGSLPAGLTLNEDTGLVSGTPTTIQTGSINVKIQNLSNSEDWDSVPLGLIIRDPS